MKKYLGVLALLLAGLLALMLGLEFIEGEQGPAELVGEEWCNSMMTKPNKEWTDSETRSFAATCLYE